MHLLFSGILLSLSFFGIGFMSDLYHSEGHRPVVKQIENNLNRRSLAVSFFIASFGMERKALCSFALSIICDTSLYHCRFRLPYFVLGCIFGSYSDYCMGHGPSVKICCANKF